MLVFGHTGVTLGVAVLLNGVLAKKYSLPTEENRSSKHPEHSVRVGVRPLSFASLGNRLDIRLLLIGSLLPDIIDKPLGQFFFRETFNNGRIFCHTLLFLILITLAGYYLYRNRRKTWLLVLSFGTFIHLIQDQMWLVHKTLLWPIYGLAFEKIDIIHWMQEIPYALRTDPGLYVPEIVGAMILVAFVAMLVRRKRVYPFIRKGQVL